MNIENENIEKIKGAIFKVRQWININKKIILIVSLIFIILMITSAIILLNIEPQQKYVIYDGNNLKESKYPGYKEKIDEILETHPNWEITLLYTRLDWNEVISNEGHKDGVKNPSNLIPDSSKYPEEFRCKKCEGKVYDNGTWLCASDEAIRHQMDPRNFLNEEEIFQFKELSYNEKAQKREIIKEITKETFLEGEETLDAICEAGKKANLDLYYIASRLIQEQGRKGTILSKGNEYKDKIVYNVFNVNAKGNSTKEIIENASKYAYERNWYSLDKSLIEGIEFMKNGYIGKGQNTLYFQKFDVIYNKEDKGLYKNQYMQNLFAPISEAKNMYETYLNSNTVNEGANFIIPLYENM